MSTEKTISSFTGPLLLLSREPKSGSGCRDGGGEGVAGVCCSRSVRIAVWTRRALLLLLLLNCGAFVDGNYVLDCSRNRTPKKKNKNGVTAPVHVRPISRLLGACLPRRDAKLERASPVGIYVFVVRLRTDANYVWKNLANDPNCSGGTADSRAART